MNILLVEIGILVAIFGVMVWRLVRGLKRDVFRQKNIVFCSLALLTLVLIINAVRGLVVLSMIEAEAETAWSEYAFNLKDVGLLISNQFAGFGTVFCEILLPMLVIGFVPVIISNIFLIKYEGYRITNLLGVALFCILVISFVALVTFSGWIAERYIASIIDGTAISEELMRAVVIFQDLSGYVIAYLQCMFLSIIICSLYTVKRKAKFDKDFVIILGCRVKGDGTPSTILARRIDRAIEFAEQQYRKTGKRVVFVASGGKGHDELISEAECIVKRLRVAGVPKRRIIIEDQSKTTFQNFLFSKKKIEEEGLMRVDGGEGKDLARVGFCTTNYHLFRAGMLARKTGFKNVEGIGSKTRWYFWPNAFIREFVGMIWAARIHHFIIIVTIIVLVVLAACTGTNY